MSFKTSSKIISERMRSQSDRYHQQRLSQIRNSKSKDPPHFKHLFNKKAALMEQQRQGQIEKENAFLLDKMSRIMDKKEVGHTKQVGHTSYKQKRYSQLPVPEVERERERIASVKAAVDDRQCGWMRKMGRMKSKQVRLPQQAQQEHVVKNPARLSFENTMKLFEDFRTLNDSREKKDLEDKFNKPEEISQRVIFYRKSIVFDETSLLLEISMAFGKLIILVFDIMKPSKIRRLVIGEKRSADLLEEYSYDYQQLANQLSISRDSISIIKRHAQTTLPSKRQDTQSHQASIIKKSPVQRQTQFLQRNFYHQVEKRKDKDKLNLTIKTPQSHNSHRLNVSHDLKTDTKPKTAVNILRKKIKFEKNKNDLVNGQTPTIKEEKTQSDLIQSDSLTSYKKEKEPYFKVQKTGIEFKKSKTQLKQSNKIDRPKQTSQQIKKQSLKQNSDKANPIANQVKISDDYDEYMNEFDPEADFQIKKPQSRSQQVRNKKQQKSSSEESELQDYEEENYEDEVDGEDQQCYANQEGEILPKKKPEEEEDYKEDFVEQNFKLSQEKSKLLLKNQRRQDIYEEDFEISKSKA